jgi:hypothetical protein
MSTHTNAPARLWRKRPDGTRMKVRCAPWHEVQSLADTAIETSKSDEVERAIRLEFPGQDAWA